MSSIARLRNFMLFILSIFFGFIFIVPVYGFEVRNLLYEVDVPCTQSGLEENSIFPGLIEKVNKFENEIEFVDRKKTPVYDSIGVVISTGEHGKYGTGFLFASPCYVLTNFHVAFGERFYRKFVLEEKNVDMTDKTLAKERVVFKVGVTSDPNKFRDQVDATAVVWGNFVTSKKTEDDWAVLKLDKCLDRYELLPIPNTDPEGIGQAIDRGARQAVLGYYSDISTTQLYGAFNCKKFVKAPGELFLRTDCSTSHGVSGGPFVLIKDGKPFVVAINSGTAITKDGVVADENFGVFNSNRVVPMYHILPKLKEYFTANPPVQSQASGKK